MKDLFFTGSRQENEVLGPRQFQNTVVLLMAQFGDFDQHGNPDGMGVELLETLMKMASNKENELMLRDYNSDMSKQDILSNFWSASWT